MFLFKYTSLTKINFFLFLVHCHIHGNNEDNLRAQLEDLVEIEKKRAGKDFARSDLSLIHI